MEHGRHPVGSDSERRLIRYGFVIGSVGVITGFVGAHLDQKPIQLAGALLAAAGVLFGGAGILLGIARFPAELRRTLRAAPWRMHRREGTVYGRPWAISLACIAGLSATVGFVLAMILVRVPPLHALMQRSGWTPDFGTGFILFGSAFGLLGYWMMRRWGVWVLGAVVATAPPALIVSGSPPVAWGNVLGAVLFLAIGIRHYRQMT